MRKKDDSTILLSVWIRILNESCCLRVSGGLVELYRISYVWYSLIGSLVCVVVGSVVSFLMQAGTRIRQARFSIKWSIYPSIFMCLEPCLEGELLSGWTRKLLRIQVKAYLKKNSFWFGKNFKIFWHFTSFLAPTSVAKRKRPEFNRNTNWRCSTGNRCHARNVPFKVWWRHVTSRLSSTLKCTAIDILFSTFNFWFVCLFFSDFACSCL